MAPTKQIGCTYVSPASLSYSIIMNLVSRHFCCDIVQETSSIHTLGYLPRLFCDETTFFVLFLSRTQRRAKGAFKMLWRSSEMDNTSSHWRLLILSVDFYWWQVQFAMNGVYAVTINKNYDGTNLYSQHVDCGNFPCGLGRTSLLVLV